MRNLRPFLVLFFGLFLTACSFSLAADVTPPPGYQAPVVKESTGQAPISGPLYPLVPPSPADGAPTYAEKCAPCHGARGLGDGERAAQLPIPVTAIGSPEVARQSTPARWYEIVTQGNLERFMPPFNSLASGDRWDVLAYVYSLSASETDMEEAAGLYAGQCARCHGETGKGDGPDAAGLSVQPKDLTRWEWVAAKSNADFYQAIQAGVAPDMPAYADQISAEQSWALADTVRSLGFAAAGKLTDAGTPAPQGTPLPSAEAPSAIATATITSTLGSIIGEVNNASGGEVPDGLKVLLHGFDGMQSVITQTTTTSAGQYAFPEVEMPEGRVFLTTIEFGGAMYGSEIATPQPGEVAIHLPIEIFEATTDTSGLIADRLHLFFEFTDEKTVRVIELYVISNLGQKTIMAEQEGEPVLSFKLPPEAANLEFQDGELGGRYLQTADGFADTAPIQPGESVYQVLYAYDMPYNKKLEMAQEMTLPANAVVVLVPEETVKVKGDALEDAGVRTVQGAAYRMYNANALQTGDVLRLTVTGAPADAVTTLATGTRQEIMFGVGALGLALIVAGVFLYRRSRSAEMDAPQEDDLVSPESENVETVMDAILALDDLYRAGDLPEDAYRQRRAELKARLRDLTGE